MSTPEETALAREWLSAARTWEIAAALETVYAGVASAVAQRGPACWASGRCCNFEKTGHLLYVTGLEAAYCVTRAERAITAADVALARAGGGCPYQIGNLCGAHGEKPLGCRVYFCDRSAVEWQRALSERSLGEIAKIHERHVVTYRYGEWRGMLAMLAGVTA